MSNAVEQVANKLKARLAEIDKEAEGLGRALAALDGGASPAPQRKRRAPQRRRQSAKRAPRGERRRQFLAAAKANPKARVSEIGKAIGVSATQAAGLARRLEADGEIKRSKRGIRVTAKAEAK